MVRPLCALLPVLLSVFARGDNLRGSGSSGHGTSITIDNFGKLVIEEKEVWLIEVGSNMCGSCRAFKVRLIRVFWRTVEFLGVIMHVCSLSGGNWCRR